MFFVLGFVKPVIRKKEIKIINVKFTDNWKKNIINELNY